MSIKMSLFIFLFAANLLAWEEIGPLGFSANRVLPDPFSPDSIYAIIGGGAAERRLELVRTIDRGASWDSLGQYESAVLHPATAETIFATLGIGSFSDGIWRSNDFGRSFEFPPPEWLYMARSVVYDPRDPSRLYACGATIDRSTDGGRRWEVVYSSIGTPDMFFTGIAVDPVRNHRIYAWDNSDRLFHSADYGSSWRLLHTFTEEMSPRQIAVAREDSCILYSACYCGLGFSRNCGIDWELLPLDPRPSNCLYLPEASPEHVLVGGAYGILISEDGGHSWETLGDDIPCSVLDITKGPGSLTGNYWYIGTERYGVMRMPMEPTSEGPILGSYFPRAGAWVSRDSFVVLVELRDPDGIDSSSVLFTVNGVEYSCSDDRLWLSDHGIHFYSYFADGETVNFSLNRVNDRLGNPCEALPLGWSIFIDRTPAELLFRFPDSAQVIDNSDITAKFCLFDRGSGADTSSLKAIFNSDTISLSSIAAIWEADTFIVHLPTAGIHPEPGETVWVELFISDRATVDTPNQLQRSWFFTISPTGVNKAEMPKYFSLRAYPNPFNQTLEINSTLPCEIVISDISGKRVTVLKTEGGKINWTPSASLHSGIYLLSALDINGSEKQIKLILLK